MIEMHLATRPTVAERYDRAVLSLRLLAARKAAAELAAAGISLSCCDGHLVAEPPSKCINGSAQKIARWRRWLLLIVRES